MSAGRINQVVLRAVLFGQTGFRLPAQGEDLGRLTTRDKEWKDPQIFSPWPQPISGGRGDYSTNPKQKLLRLDYSVDPTLCKLGENQIEVRIRKRTPYRPGEDIDLEKLELHVEYLPQSGPDR